MKCKYLSVPALCLGMFMFWLALVLRSPSFHFITRDVPLRTQIEMTVFQDKESSSKQLFVSSFHMWPQLPLTSKAATDILMPAKEGQEEGAQPCRQAGR